MTAYLESSVWPDERPDYPPVRRHTFRLSPLAVSFGLLGIIGLTSLTYAAHQLDRVITPPDPTVLELIAPDAQPGTLALGQALPVDQAVAPTFIGGNMPSLNPEREFAAVAVNAEVTYNPAFEQPQTQPGIIDDTQPTAARDEATQLLTGDEEPGPYGDPYAGTSAMQ